MKLSAPDRTHKPVLPGPAKRAEDKGPTKPDVKRPTEENELLKRLRKIDPDQAKKYRQRSGQ